MINILKILINIFNILINILLFSHCKIPYKINQYLSIFLIFLLFLHVLFENIKILNFFQKTIIKYICEAVFFGFYFFVTFLLRRRRNKNVTGGANKAYSAETHGVKI